VDLVPIENLTDEDELCGQCGLCCRIFGPTITPTESNVYLWIEQRRSDILRWFVAFRGNGTVVDCTELLPEDLGSIVSFEFRNPETGGFVTVCPFLLRLSRHRYICSIHQVKPEMCCTYQPWIWGETYFNRCKALEKTGTRNRLPP
jgi:Fe-S-cluster containining protein